MAHHVTRGDTRGRAWCDPRRRVASARFSPPRRGRQTPRDDVGWGGFGNTPDENRHSPLTQITHGQRRPARPALHRRLPRRSTRACGAASSRIPVESNGTLYVTTNDDNVWAVDATTGKVKWRWTPDNVAVFRNFGIVANRGVALCDGHVFVLTLDMTIVSLDPATGQLERRVPIAKAVPGASSNYGYSETSAPICANHRLIVGAAGSEYGVRGFVMAYHTRPHARLAEPVLDDPAGGTEWRHGGTLVGGGVTGRRRRSTPATNTLYFGTGSATPLYFPSIRPGLEPARRLADRGQPRHRPHEVVAAADGATTSGRTTPRSRRSSTRRKVGGKTQRIVSVATMEGVWFAYDAANGRPIYQRDQGDRPHRAPRAQAGKPVAVFPASLGGINYSPASYDPDTNYIFNAASETAARRRPGRADADAEEAQVHARRRLPRACRTATSARSLPGWHDHGSISAIDVATGRASGSSRRRSRSAAASRRPGAASASRAAATACCARSTSRPARCCGRSRPGIRSRPARRSTRSTARSTSPSRSAVRRRRRTAATASSCRCSRSAAPSSESPRAALCRVRSSGVAASSAASAQRDPRRPQRRAARGFGSDRRRRARSSSGRGTRTRRTSQRCRPRAAERRARGRRACRGRRLLRPARDGEGRQLPLRRRTSRSRRGASSASPGSRARRSAGTRCPRASRARCSPRRRLQRRVRGSRACTRASTAATSWSPDAWTDAAGRRRRPSACSRISSAARSPTRAASRCRAPSSSPARRTATSGRTRRPTDANGHYTSFFAASDETSADPVPLAVGVALGGSRTAATSARTRVRAAEERDDEHPARQRHGVHGREAELVQRRRLLRPRRRCHRRRQGHQADQRTWPTRRARSR